MEYAIYQKFDSVKDTPNLTVETALKDHPDVVREVITDSLSSGKSYRKNPSSQKLLVPESVITVLTLDSQAAGKFSSIIDKNKQSINEELLAALEKQSEILEREYWAREIAKQVAVEDKEMLEAILYDNVPLAKLRDKDTQNAIVDQVNQELKSRKELGIALFGNTVKTAKLEGMKNMLNNQSSHVFTNPRSRKNSQVHAIG